MSHADSQVLVGRRDATHFSWITGGGWRYAAASGKCGDQVLLDPPAQGEVGEFSLCSRVE